MEMSTGAFPVYPSWEQKGNLHGHLIKIGILKQINNSQSVAPTFRISKVNGTVRFISNFRELNKTIKRNPFPIPNIQGFLLKLEMLHPSI